MSKKILKILKCIQTYEGDGIPVTRAFPIPGVRESDPFLLFDHFGPINYEPGGATGVPAHPHCGFEAITYMLGGEVEHRDSWGGQAEIKAGDVQWMTTGSGLIHSELVTEKFKKSGGVMQGLQIWVNLPQKNKQVKPRYQHIKKNTIPAISINDNIEIKVLAGEIRGVKSKVQTYSPVTIFDIQFSKPDMTQLKLDKELNLMIYIIDGQLQFADFNKIANKGDMVFFDQSNDDLKLASISEKGSYLLLAGKPLNEPLARYGPFIANTESEVKQAMLDYQDGKMGTLI